MRPEWAAGLEMLWGDRNREEVQRERYHALLSRTGQRSQCTGDSYVIRAGGGCGEEDLVA